MAVILVRTEDAHTHIHKHKALRDAYAVCAAVKCAQPYAYACTYKGEHYTVTRNLSHQCDRPSEKQ